MRVRRPNGRSNPPVSFGVLETSERKFMDEYTIIRDFENFMANSKTAKPSGHVDIQADGERHRYHVEGDRVGTKNGCYCLYTDGLPAGWCMSWKNGSAGDKEIWTCELTDDEKKTYAQQQSNPALKAQSDAEKQARKQRRAEAVKKEQEKHDQASRKALVEYNNSKPFCHETGLIENPYWRKKFETFHGMYIDYLRLNLSSSIFPIAIVRSSCEGGFCERGSILVSMVNLATGEFQSLIKIAGKTDSNGDYPKRNYPESTIRGAGHWVIAPDSAQSQIILVSEGITTAIAVAMMNHLQGRRDAVLSVGDCGNLKPACEVLRKRYPESVIVLMADNDRLTKLGRNPGLDAANECVRLGLADKTKAPTGQGRDWYDELFTRYKEERIEANIE